MSRTTVTAAYRSLRETGHLTSRRGAGSWTTLPNGHRVASSGLWTPDDDLDMHRHGGRRARLRRSSWCRAARAAADDLPRYLGSAGYHPAGLPELREAVAEPLHRPRRAHQRRADPHHQRHTAGAGPGAAAVRAARRRRAGGVADLSERAGRAVRAGAPGSARTASIRELGWDGELLLGALRQTRPRLAYVIPEFHNPTGHLMPAEPARASGRRGARHRHRPGRRRVLRGPAAGRRADAAAGGGVRPALPGGVDRRDEQGVLGWSADRLGPRVGSAGAAAGRGAGRRGHGQPGAGAARRRAPAGPRRRDRRDPPGAAGGPARRARRDAARACCRSGGSRCRPAA